MKEKIKNLQIQILDRHLLKIWVCDRPANGWISAIRKALCMSTRQVAERIGITQQSAARLESNEADDSITLKSLRKVGEALDCKLVYAFVPNDGSLLALVKKTAFQKATEIVDSVDHTMQLEGQSVGDKNDKIQQLADELEKNINTKLWD
jgi:predicted DNA-binding mobile mystery protein A